MHGKLSGPAGRAPGAAGKWEEPETEEESVTTNAEGAETELGPCGVMRNGFLEDGGPGKGGIKKVQSSLQEASGAPGWAGREHPS